MSSNILARVYAFNEKAGELADKGHLLRAAENYGRAAEAARALGADNNLVVLNMLLRQGNMHGIYAAAAAQENVVTADPRILAAHRAKFIALLSGAVEELERRRVAGTLLEGKCAAVEEQWCAHELQRVNIVRELNLTAVEVASLAALVGYEQFMHAAGMAADFLARAEWFEECTGAQLQSFAPVEAPKISASCRAGLECACTRTSF